LDEQIQYARTSSSFMVSEELPKILESHCGITIKVNEQLVHNLHCRHLWEDAFRTLLDEK